ncbi:cyclic-di-AMP receptor [Evansella cellulosilytica]|uniref:Transcriptional regulator n=1 Tax=Evansella cellulosilytica (strain ATCC 21833 / DSM 2522 / FERM P-1141 / JCM 9156 / N-4) TaxID=649639 RepID=E6U224_EVAC2|nr:cyclic-di-AMP receptor [Evansella cellulosilytica]ADU29268.1 protein of unknown function DUF970 [Evansella cellulosilytica DSM 2522]
MKLMVCVVHDRYADDMEEKLKEKGYRMTELASSGGFLRKGSTTFLFGIKDEDVNDLQNLMKQICLDVEKKKGKLKDGQSRFTYFVMNANESLPFLKNTN